MIITFPRFVLATKNRKTRWRSGNCQSGGEERTTVGDRRGSHVVIKRTGDGGGGGTQQVQSGGEI